MKSTAMKLLGILAGEIRDLYKKADYEVSPECPLCGCPACGSKLDGKDMGMSEMTKIDIIPMFPKTELGKTLSKKAKKGLPKGNTEDIEEEEKEEEEYDEYE